MKRKLLFALSLGLLSFNISNAQNVVALTTGGQLMTFNAATPGTVTANVSVTNLSGNQLLVGMDFRPATGQLFALGYDNALTVNNAQLYTINYTTGVATAVGSAVTLSLGTGNVGFDFNPTVDRIRVVASNGANYRLNPNTGGIAATDGTLTYAVGDVNVAETPSIGSAAYSNSYIGSEATTLYVMDDSLNTLVIQNPPNAGTLNTLNTTGLTITGWEATSDIDIFFDPVTKVNMAYLVANVGSSFNDGLYTINLATGATTMVGMIGAGNMSLSDIAVVIDRADPGNTGDLIYALTRINRNLISFDSDHPEYIRSLVPVTGVTAGQVIVAMDVRPADLQLYALGYNSSNNDYQLYTINTTTGAATAINGVGTIALGTGNIGFDFNPTVDRIRVVSSSGANFRLNPNTGGIAATDASLSYDPMDVAFGNTPNVSGVAYTNSYAGVATTSLFGIDDNLGSLVNIALPNTGVLTTNTIGIYTFNMADLTTDIDFFFDSTMGGFNVGYIAANTGSSNNDMFYEMPVIGNPSLVGSIGLGIGVYDIASQLLYTGTTNLSLELGVGNTTATSKIEVYPNPATDQLYVSLPAAVTDAEIVITDISGKVLISAKASNQPVSVSALATGMYILNLKVEGKTFEPVKFIKQ